MSSKWADEYLNGPFTAPDPVDETGPGTHFRSTFAPQPHSPSNLASPPPSATFNKSPSVMLQEQPTGSSTSTNPFRRGHGSMSKAPASPSSLAYQSSRGSYPTPPASASPRAEKFPAGPSHAHRASAFASYGDDRSPRASKAGPSGHNRRSSSLSERYPGDNSHRPLEVIRKESKKAHRSPHMRKHHQPGSDVIDRLDLTPYHHEGPYDAALMSRNISYKSSPIAALHDSNEEALKATPKENIINSVHRHRPLEGVASIPPGMADRFGRTYDYEEGTDMMRDPVGNYKRWPGVQYHPDDLKGKGEPSYTVEKALKDHKLRNANGEQGIEMTTRSRNKSMGHADDPRERVDAMWGDGEPTSMERASSTSKKVTEGLKRRWGSIKKKRSSMA